MGLMDKDRVIEMLREVQKDVADCRYLLINGDIMLMNQFLIVMSCQINIYIKEINMTSFSEKPQSLP